MSNPIKITFVINNLNGGGAERILVNILNNIDRDKFIPRLFLFEYEGDFINNLKKDIEIGWGIKPKNDNKIVKIFLKYIYRSTVGRRKLKNFLKNDDIVVAFLEKLTTYNVAKVIKKSNIASIAWLHNNINEFSIINKFLSKRYYKKYDKIFCVSNECTFLAKNYLNDESNKIETIYNPIDINEIINKSMLESKFKLPDGKNIIAIGRLNRQKGFDILVEAFSKLEYSNTNLIILGEGEEREKLEEKISGLKLKDRVYLPGFVDNPYAVLKGADLFVLSSRFEGLPTVLIEALALEKKIVSTKCSGSSEILLDGKFGCLVEVESVDDLANGINNLLKDKYEFKSGIIRANDFNKVKIISKLENKLIEIYKNKIS